MIETKSMYLEELMPLIVEQLDRGSSVRIYPRGTSMLPMIREGLDSVVLSSVPERPSKYDVMLYQRKNGQYVLHRLVGVGDKYDFLGDNQFCVERGITHEQLIARVSSVSRGEKQIGVDQPSYKLFCRIWYYSRFIRRVCRRSMELIRRAINKCKKKV